MKLANSIDALRNVDYDPSVIEIESQFLRNVLNWPRISGNHAIRPGPAVLVKTLDKLDRGSRGEILAMSDDWGRSRRLRRIGLREGLVVEVVNDGDPVLLRFDGCSVAISRDMLRDVTICRCGCEREDRRSQIAARRRAEKRAANA